MELDVLIGRAGYPLPVYEELRVPSAGGCALPVIGSLVDFRV